MALFDFPLEQLRNYKPQRLEPIDFDEFWSLTLGEARQHPIAAKFEPADFGLRAQTIYDVTFAGFGGDEIKGWLIIPRARENNCAKLPCVIEYVGYGGGRGFPTDWLLWSSAGYAHFVMDTRGQGSAWRKGDTQDSQASGPSYPGFMTRGITDPKTYYYRRLITDAVRAVEAVKAFPEIDLDRIAVTGISQGGGLSLAVSGLLPEIKIAMPDVPFLCHYRRATEISDADPYQEISRYLCIHRNSVEKVFETLGYFDGVNFSSRAKANALFSVGLMDKISPPSTVFAAYNHWNGPKQVSVYHYNGHEGGGELHTLEKIRFLGSVWR